MFHIRLRSFTKKEELYRWWVEFWEAIEPVKKVRLDEICAGEDDIPGYVLERLKKNGISTIGDFLLCCVTNTVTDMWKKYTERTAKSYWIVAKNKIFEKIRERIVLTVRTDE